MNDLDIFLQLQNDRDKYEAEASRLSAWNDELCNKLDKAEADAERLAEALANIAEYHGEGRINAPWQQIVKSLGDIARAALVAHEDLGGTALSMLDGLPTV